MLAIKKTKYGNDREREGYGSHRPDQGPDESVALDLILG